MSQGRKEEALHVFTVAAERFPGVPLVISPFHHHNQVNYQLCLSIPDSPSLSFSLFLSLSLCCLSIFQPQTKLLSLLPTL